MPPSGSFHTPDHDQELPLPMYHVMITRESRESISWNKVVNTDLNLLSATQYSDSVAASFPSSHPRPRQRLQFVATGLHMQSTVGTSWMAPPPNTAVVTASGPTTP